MMPFGLSTVLVELKGVCVSDHMVTVALSPASIVLSMRRPAEAFETFILSSSTTSVIPLGSEEFVDCFNDSCSSSLDAVAPSTRQNYRQQKLPCLD